MCSLFLLLMYMVSLETNFNQDIFYLAIHSIVFVFLFFLFFCFFVFLFFCFFVFLLFTLSICLFVH